MHRSRTKYVIICALIVLQLQGFVRTVDSYEIPDVNFEIVQGKLRVWIPADPTLRIFAFHGNVNKGITESDPGDISGEVYRGKDGRWSIQDRQRNLQDGDVIHYWVYVQADGVPYQKSNLRWTVSHGGNAIDDTTANERTTVRTSTTNLLFNEDFNSLNTSVWLRDIRIPQAPDYEFCVYHNENHENLVKIENGVLRLTPLLLEDYYGESAVAFGKLQLSECTSTIEAECIRQAFAFNILPPILTAHFTTKQSFSFRYGVIEVRAKFPEGDWIYPEMWLEPKYMSYGRGYQSGRVLLGLSRGNEHLVKITDRSIYDSRKLDFGVRVGPPENVRQYIVSKINETGSRWTQDFHIYTTSWTTDGFRFYVDGVEVGRLDAGPNGWLENNPTNTAKTVAPFDQEFYISLGVSVGGVRVFPDGTISSGFTKPWKNTGAKAMLHFWDARNDWLPSWRKDKGRKTAFEIDYIRVWPASVA